jgi:NAD(P)H-dependent FMN reductase
LLQSGWRIDRTTASQLAPADVTTYDLIVLGSPVYASAAATPLQDYIARVGDFHGKPVVLLFTAGGDASGAMDAAATMLESAHGRVIARFGYTSRLSNRSTTTYPGSFTDQAVAMARDAARSLAIKSD